MKLKIHEKNKEKIEEVLKQIQGKARERIFDYIGVESLIKIAEEKLDKLGIKKKNRHKCTYRYSDSYYQKSKKYRSVCTIIEIERNRNDWYLTDAKRELCWPNGENKIMLSDDARDQKLEDILKISKNRVTSIK